MLGILKVDLNKVDLNLLKLLSALLTARNVTVAGQMVGLSQPAASRGLARLRQLFNDQLFVRTAQGWQLTPRAEALSGSVARLLEDAKAIVAPATFEPSTAQCRFTIATADHLAALLMPKLLSKLAKHAPGVDLVIPARAGNNIHLVAEGGADFAIGVYDDLPARFYQRRLFNEDFVCLVRRDHPVLAKPFTLAQFASLSHISVSITGMGNSAVDEALAKQGLKRRVAVRLPHFLAAPMLVAETDMVLTLPSRFAQQIASMLPVAVLAHPLNIDSFTPSIIWHGRQHDNPAHIWLRNLIVAIAEEL
ncbi:LysR family transcriptional regulator [Motilimonas sp. E26]|uniref:LysR family transcriptional regulator n=1 Tax=Motilimonas sp. E26 TaxID=2865674 RepID=UPI001E4393C5|nr:LysR family transcriptional regulator [Motilimonas sp. E26]MCE0558524.1 LysR family transcriptional regulator [Motilimonas sp. E26]